MRFLFSVNATATENKKKTATTTSILTVVWSFLCKIKGINIPYGDRSFLRQQLTFSAAFKEDGSPVRLKSLVSRLFHLNVQYFTPKRSGRGGGGDAGCKETGVMEVLGEGSDGPRKFPFQDFFLVVQNNLMKIRVNIKPRMAAFSEY